MITVKATEFHNKVGYYLDLLAKGKKIKIVSVKPKKEDLILEGSKESHLSKKGRAKELIDFVNDHQFKSDYWKSGLELQDAVRD